LKIDGWSEFDGSCKKRRKSLNPGVEENMKAFVDFNLYQHKTGLFYAYILQDLLLGVAKERHATRMMRGVRQYDKERITLMVCTSASGANSPGNKIYLSSHTHKKKYFRLKFSLSLVSENTLHHKNKQ
jgi:hypothetical protein